MTYELRAGITTGRIDAGDLGTFSIESHTLEVDDYDVAQKLVRRHAVEWPNGDPGPPPEENASETTDESDSSDDTDGSDGPEEDDSLVEALQKVTIEEFEEELEAGRFDGRLEAVEAAEKEGKDRDGVQDAIDAYRDE